MARIRTIKPEFFTSEDVVSLTPLARLLYIALWCEADREGRMLWKPKTWWIRYLPADLDTDIVGLATELTARSLVKRYGPSGEFAVIPRFPQHQHINPREAASKIPAPTESSFYDETESTRDDACPTRAHASHQDLTRREEGKGREGKGREGVTASREAPFVPETADFPPDLFAGDTITVNGVAGLPACWPDIGPDALAPCAIALWRRFGRWNAERYAPDLPDALQGILATFASIPHRPKGAPSDCLLVLFNLRSYLRDTSSKYLPTPKWWGIKHREYLPIAITEPNAYSVDEDFTTTFNPDRLLK